MGRSPSEIYRMLECWVARHYVAQVSSPAYWGLSNVRRVGHSYGGRVISGVADCVPERLKRRVYVNAFVPQPGECLNDRVPPHDADLALAESAFAPLNPHRYKTFADAISLSQPMAASPLGKSCLNCQQDTALPHSMPWHPRLSERLGLFRRVECPGSHAIWFTNPARLAQAIIEAGRD